MKQWMTMKSSGPNKTHRTLRVMLGLLVLMALAGPTWSVEAQPRGLDTFESRYYSIHTNLNREEALEYGVHMDLIFKEYARRFAVLRGDQRGKQDLYLLRTRGDYIEAMAKFGIRAEASGGMFFWGGSVSGLATWVEGLSRDQVFDTLQHEGFHQFAHSKLGDQLPLWVNEGLAEYFGAAIVVKGDVRLGIVDGDRVDRIIGAFKTNQAIDFEELLNLGSQQWQNNMLTGSAKGHLQYDQSWATVHFLIHGDGGRYQNAFGEYLVLISRGRAHIQAFRQTFGDDNQQFANRWMKFLSEVEPDPYSTALKRIQFLGTGLEYLQQQKLDAPADVAGLRKTLQEKRYVLSWLTEAGEKSIDAADDELYAYLDKSEESQPFEIIPAAAGSDMPPSIAAPQLKPSVTLVWERDKEGNLRSQLEFGRGR